MSADSLTVSSRNFYEMAKFKVAASITIASFSLMLLGFCSSAGAIAQAYSLVNDMKGLTDTQKDANDALSAGYGFATFIFIIAFIVSLASAIYYSSVLCGSANEKRTLKNPFEIETIYAEYGSSNKQDSEHGSNPSFKGQV